MGNRSSVSAASFTKINILLDVIRLLNYISRAPNLRRKHSLYEADYHPTIRRIVHMRRSCLCRMGFCRIPFGGRGRFVLPASHVCCSFTSKTFQGKPLPAKQDVRLRRDFKSSAVAVVHACRICNMASIAGVRPVFDGAARCQPSGFFSIVESERLWQVKPLPLPTTSSTTCRA